MIPPEATPPYSETDPLPELVKSPVPSTRALDATRFPDPAEVKEEAVMVLPPRVTTPAELVTRTDPAVRLLLIRFVVVLLSEFVVMFVVMYGTTVIGPFVAALPSVTLSKLK